MSWPLEVKQLRDMVVMRMDMSIRGAALVDVTRAMVQEFTTDPELVEAVLDEIFGLGALEPRLRDRSVTAIGYRPSTGLVAERDGTDRPVERGFRDDPHARRVIARILGSVGHALPAPGAEETATLGDGTAVRAWAEQGRIAFRFQRPKHG